MKKILAFFLICITVTVFIPKESDSVGTVNLSSNKNSVYVGDEFSISVNLSGVSVVTLTTRISVDSSRVEYVSGPSNSNYSNGKVIYTWTDPNGGASPISSGIIATFKFKSKSTGIANFTITGDFYDANENQVIPTFSGKSITIAEIPTPTNQTNTTDEISTPINNTNQIQTDSGNSASTLKSNLSTNAYLKSLQLNIEGISPQFSRNVNQYYITVMNTVNSITVSALPENVKAKVSISGNTDLKIGLNKILITVIAEDGKTKQTYTINVSKTDDKNKSNSNLENLAIDKYQIIPEFNSEVTEYTCEINGPVSEVKILAVPQNEKANVEILGNQDLKVGENIITINVTAQDGLTYKKYTIRIIKRDEVDENEVINENINKSEEKMNLENNNKKKSIIPLLILLIFALLAGICYKKFIKNNKKES